MAGYRISAKPKRKKKRPLLYKKPWWKIWTDRHAFVIDERKYVWYSTRKWIHNSSVLYYTNKRNWVVLVKFQASNRVSSTLSTYYIFRHSSTLKGLRTLINASPLKTGLDPIDGHDVVVKTFEKLLAVKKEANKPEPVKVRL